VAQVEEPPSAECHRSRSAGFAKDCRGATAVEFALIAPPFIALLIAIVQTFLVFFAQEMLEGVVQKSSRQILTGQTQSQQATQAAFHQTVCNQVSVLFACNKIFVDVRVATSWSTADTSALVPTYDSQGNVNNMQFNPGNAGDIVVVRVVYLWPVVLGPLGFNLSNQPNNTRLILATAAFQNEPSS
jgi:Flp pilus assembly protein TadG